MNVILDVNFWKLSVYKKVQDRKILFSFVSFLLFLFFLHCFFFFYIHFLLLFGLIFQFFLQNLCIFELQIAQ